MYRYILFLLLTSLATGCKVFHPNNMFRTSSDFQFRDFTELDKEYKIKPFDEINLIVVSNEGAELLNFKAADRTQQQGIQIKVEYDGLVKLPSLGRTDIAGKTIREAEKFLEEKYSSLYRDPYVKIEITNRRVFIFSDGGSNGSVLPLNEENYTLIEALASIGGLSFDSKAYRIKLIRGNLNDDPEVYIYNIYNLKDIKNANLLLKANDIIFIESRPRYASRVLTEIAPYLSLISTVLLIYGLFTR